MPRRHMHRRDRHFRGSGALRSVSRSTATHPNPAMKLYPLFADLSRRAVLVVGGGGVAERKVAALLAADA